MKTTEIILIASLFALVAFRLYKKYSKASGTGTGGDSGSILKSNTKEEEYEPYSKK
jgi:hypothetical protein